MLASFVKIFRRAGWAPLAVFLVHAVASGSGAYRIWPAFDAPMHLVGGFVIAFFFAESLAVVAESGVLGQPSRLLLGIAIFALTCTAAVFWEFAEWSVDLYFGSVGQLGIVDTMRDMARGIAGGGVFVALWAASSRTSTA